MALAVRLTRTGSPEVMALERVDQLAPGPNEVWVEHEAIGVNYLDVMQRKGAAPIPVPGGLGLEAAGRVGAVGPGVGNVAVGDRVAYILGGPGSYATGRLYAAERLVPIPESLTFEDAAAILFKGITAQYLLKTTYPVGPGTVILLYGVGGGVGQLMAPWAKHLGATLIGVVSKEASVDRAKASGCDAVLVWGACDLPAEVSRITEGRKANVVYDAIGRETFQASLDSLGARGVFVSFGASTGAPPPVEISTLGKSSLFLTRPSLATHATDVAEYQERAADVFSAVAGGIIKPAVWRTYPLSEVVAAHTALEQGASAGTILLKP
jgi:NADPH:quinone reductase